MVLVCLPITFDVTLQLLSWFHGSSAPEDSDDIGCCIIQITHINEAQTRVVNVYMSCGRISCCATLIPCSHQNPRWQKYWNFAPLYEDSFCCINTLSAISPIFYLRFSTKMTIIQGFFLKLITSRCKNNSLSLPDITGLGSRCRLIGRQRKSWSMLPNRQMAEPR